MPSIPATSAACSTALTERVHSPTKACVNPQDLSGAGKGNNALPVAAPSVSCPLRESQGGGPARKESPFTGMELMPIPVSEYCLTAQPHSPLSCVPAQPAPSIPACPPHHLLFLPLLPRRCQKWQAGLSSSMCKTATAGSAHLKIAFPRSRQNSWALMEFAEKLISANWQQCQAPPGPAPS